MSGLKAICPCCGGEISFDSGAEKVTCPACRTELIASAMKADEEVPRTGYERGREEHEARAPLTQEEREHELKRKAAFKSELKSIVERIDELHERRPELQRKRRSIRGLALGGVLAAIVSVLVLVSERSPTKSVSLTLIIAAFIAAVSLTMLILSFICRAKIIKKQDELESEMRAKKEKRDVLIGRLNKIESRLQGDR